MKLIILIILSLVSIICYSQEAKTITIKVKSSQNLETLAEIYSVTSDIIFEANKTKLLEQQISSDDVYTYLPIGLELTFNGKEQKQAYPFRIDL